MKKTGIEPVTATSGPCATCKFAKESRLAKWTFCAWKPVEPIPIHFTFHGNAVLSTTTDCPAWQAMEKKISPQQES
jgi:hypothetical protein